MASSSLLLPELKFLAPQITPKRRRSVSRLCSCCSVYRNSRYNYNYNVAALRMRIRAVKEEGALTEELVERASDVKWSGNGAAVGNGSNGSVRGYVNGSLGVSESGNGSLVKYMDGNGVAAEVVEDSEEASKRREDGKRKRKLEEIGKEDAWFKQSGEAQVEI